MMKVAASLLLVHVLVLTSPAFADAIAVRLGPPAVGQGGPNPLTLSPVELGVTYMTEQRMEVNVSFTGVFVGKRQESGWGGYVSVGGGGVLSANGVGPGVYAAFGADLFCGWLCFSAEYTQAVGVSGSDLISPYGIRVGVIKWY